MLSPIIKYNNMMTYQNLTYSIREICRGSGVINLATISIATVVLYILLGFFLNRDIFIFLMETNSDIQNSGNSLRNSLEKLHYQNIHMLLIPLINVVIFMEVPLKEQISNQLIRTLPISPLTRLLAIAISIVYIATVSLILIIIIDFGIIYYIRTLYMQKLIELQEGIGILHTQLEMNKIFSTNLNYINILGLSESIFVIFYAVLFGFIRLNVLQFFDNYSFTKTFLIVGILIFAVNKFLSNFLDLSSANTEQMQVDTPIYIVVYVLATLLILFSTYYTLKEREE